jgi:IS30 family transposase
MFHSELSVEERATIQIGHAQGLGLRRIASLISFEPRGASQP